MRGEWRRIEERGEIGEDRGEMRGKINIVPRKRTGGKDG